MITIFHNHKTDIQLQLYELCEAAAADELKDIRWQSSDRDCARELSKSSQFLSPIEPTGGVAHKLSLLVQMELSQIDFPSGMIPFDSQRLRGETTRALEVMNRLIRAVIECKASQQDGDGCSVALSLARSLSTKAWEHGPAHLIQVPQVGKALMRKLVGANIRTVVDLADTPASTIERIASRNPPFGKKMTDALAWFPRLTLHPEVKATRSIKGIKSLDIDATLGFANTVGMPKWGNKIPAVTLLARTSKGASIFFWRNSLKVFTRGRNTHTLSFSWTPESFEEDLFCQFACEEIAGTLVTQRLAHNLNIDDIQSFTKPTEEQLQSTKTQRVTSYLGLDEDISDNELLVAVQEVPKKQPREANPVATVEKDHATKTDDFPQMDREGNIKTPGTEYSLGSQTRDSGSRKMADRGEQPVRLENSNFKCGHSCSWSTGGKTARGVQCGHQCCREGSKHPPKPNKRNGKRKSEDEGVPTPKSTESSDCVKPQEKRTRKTEPTSRANAHTSPEQYTVDEDGFVDLTRGEEDLGPRAAAPKRVFNYLDDGLDMDLDGNELQALQWPLETPDACSGETLFDETLISEDDSCWTEFFALDPSRRSPDNSGDSVSDRWITEGVEAVVQSVPPKHDSATHDETENLHPFAPSNQWHCQAFDAAEEVATSVAGPDEKCVNDDANKRHETAGEPEWVNEIDSGLIEELRGFVDFV